MTTSRPLPLPLGAYVAAFLAAAGVALLHACFTNAAWEDWYITFRASKNLALGHGLVFTPGERVHSFTSPLGTLIPAGLAWVIGPQAHDAVLWAYRVLSCLMLGAAAAILLDVLARWGWSLWPLVLGVAWFALDAKIAGFSINGMECAFTVFFLVLTLGAYVWRLGLVSAGLLMGVGWAGLMWSRPDGFIYIAGLGLGFLVLGVFAAGEDRRGSLLRAYFIAAAVCTVLYLPWFAGAWMYYGTPVPNTVVAKGLNVTGPTPLERLLAMGLFPWVSLARDTSLDANLIPAYAVDSGWHDSLPLVSRALSWVAAFAWLVPGLDRRVRAVSVASLVSHLYLSAVVRTVYPWYLPPATVLSIVVIAGLAEAMWRQAGQARRGRVAVAAAVVAVLAWAATLSVAAAYKMGARQVLVEDGNRRLIGQWLAENARSPQDTVFIECLGYVGFFSNLPMRDYPGLGSPQMIAARRELGTNRYGPLIDHLRPDWLVLRPSEARAVRRDAPGLLREQYRLARRFDVRDQVDAIAFLPGRDHFEFDATFEVYARRR